MNASFAAEPGNRPVIRGSIGRWSIRSYRTAIAAVGGVLEQAPKDWDRVIETNLTACFLLSKLAPPSMDKQRRGKIINIASMYAFFGAAFVPSYRAAKGALVQLTKSMAIELAPFNIQLNAFAPGFIETDLTEFVKTTPMHQEVMARTPAGRWAHPDECAGAAVFLASRASDFVTGSTLVVDEGYAMR